MMSYIDPGLLKASEFDFSFGMECLGLEYGSLDLDTLVEYVDEVTRLEPVDMQWSSNRSREYEWSRRVDTSDESDASENQAEASVLHHCKTAERPSQEPQLIVVLRYTKRKLIKRIRSRITPMEELISNPVYQLENRLNHSPSPPAVEPPLPHKTIDSVYYSKLNAAQLSVLLKLDGYSVGLTKAIEDQIMDVFAKYCNFNLGYSTWIRSTSKYERHRHVNLLHKIFRKVYPTINRKMIEVILRRGTYRIMQRRLRQIRRARASHTPPRL